MVNIKSVGDKKMLNFARNNSASRKSKESLRIIVTVFLGIAIGFFIGMSFPILSSYRLNFYTSGEERYGEKVSTEVQKQNVATEVQKQNDPYRIWVPSNPRGAERLPPAIVAAESDLYQHLLYGNPSEDLKIKPNYLVTFTVGYNQKQNIDAAVKKFSENFTIVLFHYDGRTTEWNEFEWAKQAIHISVPKQTKWWYAKRFLHPDIVAPYDYIFMWDEDLGVEHFNAEEYIKLVRKHGLEISQPGLDHHSRGMTWQMTERQGGREVHKVTKEKPGWCGDPHLPPCAAFVEIMAPVFSREAWRCVWYLIQNDLVHGWGLDFALQKCVEPAHEKIGVVDAQWVVHQGLPSLGSQGKSQGGKAPWQGVRDRCKKEWAMFQKRVSDAEKAYNKSIGIDGSNIKSQKSTWWANQGKV